MFSATILDTVLDLDFISSHCNHRHACYRKWAVQPKTQSYEIFLGNTDKDICFVSQFYRAE